LPAWRDCSTVGLLALAAIVTLIVVPGGGIAASAPHQEAGSPPASADRSEAALQSHSYAISTGADGFSGPGVDWIVTSAENAQFVMFGEQHGVDAIPRFVADAYELLQPAGFDHLALEIGPWIALQLSTLPVDEVIARYPHSITFDGNGELELLRTAQRLGNPDSGRLFWGIDQMITAIHPLERMVELSSSPGEARMARGFLLKSLLKTGQYLRQGHYFDLGALRGAFEPARGTEAELILDAAEVSMRIFTLYRQRRIDESVQLRETYMGELLRLQHDDAALPGAPLPRAVFKMGGAHIMEGIGPNGIPTLGDFAQKLAATHGSDALNIGIRAYSAELFGFPRELIEGRDGILIDTRALRPMLAADSSGDEPSAPLASLAAALSEERRADIMGFDAVIFLNTPATAPEDEIRGAETTWRQGVVRRVAPIALCLLILLSGLALPLVTITRAILRRQPAPEDAPALAGLVAAAYALGASASIGWQAAVLLRNPLQQPIGWQPAALGPLAFLLLLTGALVMSGYAAAAWRRGLGSIPGRLHYTIMSAAAAALVVLCWMWRLPGIPG
jgi:hypothetical protein